LKQHQELWCEALFPFSLSRGQFIDVLVSCQSFKKRVARTVHFTIALVGGATAFEWKEKDEPLLTDRSPFGRVKMGNVHVFNQRFPALASSLFSSLSLAFLWIAGTSCGFVEVSASEGRYIENTNESFQTGVTSASFGILCESDYFDSDGDTMWLVSKAFLSLSLAMGSFTTASAWILTYAIPPTDRTWKALSIMSAITAVFTIPIFLIFESEPCTIDMTRQQCSLSFGSYILIAGTLSAIAVTILTQCIDAPQWGIELDAWKVCKRSTEETEHPSRDNVSSNECDADPEYSTPPDAPVATTLGVLELVQCWNERRKLARYSDLEQGKTFGTSGDAEDEANVPFAEAGSYYANSNNSRLVLRVTPDGKLPNDEQKSDASFGDLDDYIKMIEDEHELGSAIGCEMSTTSLDDFMENTSVPDVSSQREGEILCILPIDAIANSDNEQEKFSEEPEKLPDEPQFYSELKPLSATNLNKSLLVYEDTESSEEEDSGPGNKLSIGIRSLTNLVRDSSRLAKNSGRKYAMMDDDDEESYANSIPGVRGSATDDQSSRAATPTPVADHLHHQKLRFDWNALHAAANAGVLLGQEPRSDSSDEDDPEQPYFTPNETSGDSSLGHVQEDTDDDDDSTYSGSSLSDASGDVEKEEKIVGEGVVPSPRKEKVRRGRKSRRETSSVRSVSSYTSLLDMTIDEETDMDLKEFLSSEEESVVKQLSNGYKSAPETLGGGNRGMSPYQFVQSETHPANAEKGYIISRTKVFDSSHESSLKVFDSSQESSLDSITQDVLMTPVKLDYRAADEETNLHSRRCRSMSIPRRKKRSSIHPYVASPKSSLFPNSSFEDVPPEKTTPWREERLYKGGIHNPAVHIVSDDENSDEQYMSSGSTRSAKSSISQRARKARIRRLQLELEDSTASRKRSRTLDPPKIRRRTKEASYYDLNSDLNKTVFRYDLPERDNPTLNRLLFGRDYSPDEASL
jgi:hypothetical protein